jgi:hypothetical protein
LNSARKQKKIVKSRLYLARKEAFDRRRRKTEVSFDELYRLFAGDTSIREVAKRAGVSAARMKFIYQQHFSGLFGISAIERRSKRERSRRKQITAGVNAMIAEDPVLKAIQASAKRGKATNTIRPIFLDRSTVPRKLYRHRAVLVGKKIEPVYHIQNSRSSRGRRLNYSETTIRRDKLEAGTWSIFVIDVPGFLRRVIRSRNKHLLRTVFTGGRSRTSIYIPLDGRPENPRYDFLADEDNWD